MSFWLSPQPNSNPAFYHVIIYGYTLRSHPIRLFFLWAFFVTAVTILIVALRATHRTGNVSNGQIPHLRSSGVSCMDEEKAAISTQPDSNS